MMIISKGKNGRLAKRSLALWFLALLLLGFSPIALLTAIVQEK